VGDSVRWSATKIAQAIRSRKLSCETVIREHVARIEEVNPKLNAVVQLCLERAMKEARSADEALSRDEPCRIAFFRSNGIFEPCVEIAAAVDLAVKLLGESGVSVEEARPAVIEDAYDLTLALWTADGGAGFEAILRDAGTNEIHPFMARVLDVCRSGAKSGADLTALLERRSRFRSEALRFIEPFDILLSPVLPFLALPHGTTFDTDRFPGFSYTMIHNLTGWPAVVVRAGTAPNGLPIGVQLAAKPWREDVAIAIAQHLEEALGPWRELSV
jgi:amidase